VIAARDAAKSGVEARANPVRKIPLKPTRQANNALVKDGPGHVWPVPCNIAGKDQLRSLWDNPDFLAVRIHATPLRRIGDPLDVAGAAMFPDRHRPS
jgi:hypothetical protein